MPRVQAKLGYFKFKKVNFYMNESQNFLLKMIVVGLRPIVRLWDLGLQGCAFRGGSSKGS